MRYDKGDFRVNRDQLIKAAKEFADRLRHRALESNDWEEGYKRLCLKDADKLLNMCLDIEEEHPS